MLLVNNGVPYGLGELKWQYGSWWIVSVMAGKYSKAGTGKRILRSLLREAKLKSIPNLRLGTHFNNIPMLYCALSCGFKLDGTNSKGYVLSKEIND